MRHINNMHSGASSQGATSVSALVAAVFLAITVLASVLIYGVYLQQRDAVIARVGHIEAQQTAGLIFEHLYSVMRRGWTRDQVDQVVHQIGQRLPDYEIDVVRGEAVARQYGELPGDVALRRRDAVVAAVIARQADVFIRSDDMLRYGFAVTMKAECAGCHAAATPGEINGVIRIGIPAARLREPIEAAILPMTALVAVVVLVLFGAIFLALRERVVLPVQHFAASVSQSTRDLTAIRIRPGSHWPREILSLANNFNRLMDRIHADLQQLEDTSLHDPLTNLFNRRHFDTVLSQAKLDADDGADPFTVLLLDLDDFKPINDGHGHAAGDAMLVAVAQAIRGVLRDVDLAARVGGDEFAVIAMATAASSAAELRERVRKAVIDTHVRFGTVTLSVGCSLGAASYHQGIACARDLLQIADNEMYADKCARKARRGPPAPRDHDQRPQPESNTP